jgi:hypothetical protein
LGYRAIVLGGLAALVMVAFGAASAWAEASTHCVKATKVGKKFTGGWNNTNCTAVNATHEGKYEKLASFSESEEQQLKALLKYVKVQASGVAGKPTVQFSGVNVQVVSGAGKTNAAVNGEGNLVIGYDETPGTQTGSHNLVLGEGQAFTSFGGIVAGLGNTISGEYASVSGGFANVARARFASVSGGSFNTASGEKASVSGGVENEASGLFAWVGGGVKNTASGTSASIFGAKGFEAKNEYDALPGCFLPGKAGEYC